MSEFSEQLSRLSEQLDSKHTENIERLIHLEEAVKHLDSCFDSVKTKLFEKGGILQMMEGRLTELEKWAWRATGAGFILINVLLFVFQTWAKR